MADITVSKAQDSGGVRTPDAHVHITGEPPEYLSLRAWDMHCEQQASELERALVHSLPGGIYDRLLGHMLARKATHFRVPLETGGVNGATRR